MRTNTMLFMPLQSATAGRRDAFAGASLSPAAHRPRRLTGILGHHKRTRLRMRAAPGFDHFAHCLQAPHKARALSTHSPVTRHFAGRSHRHHGAHVEPRRYAAMIMPLIMTCAPRRRSPAMTLRAAPHKCEKVAGALFSILPLSLFFEKACDARRWMSASEALASMPHASRLDGVDDASKTH